MKKFLGLLFIATILFGTSCTNDKKGDNIIDTLNDKPVVRIKGPVFSCDTAFKFVKTQVDFGPRIPETKAHQQCADFITQTLKSYGYSPSVSNAPATEYTGVPIHMINIFAQFHAERKQRVLLLAHWDTRPVADEDTVGKDKPFDGANDGASGAGVLLEMARILQQKDPNIGVDLLFSDAEDAGNNGGEPTTWCLGTQYWASNLPKGYTADFGILLDMVGGRGAVFPREGEGMYFASGVVEKVWSAAQGLGYRDYFVNDVIGRTTDDHAFVNQIARIPCIDIVAWDFNRGSYPYFHHTHADNMSIIECSTLGVVGNVLVDVIYNENVK